MNLKNTNNWGAKPYLRIGKYVIVRSFCKSVKRKSTPKKKTKTNAILHQFNW